MVRPRRKSSLAVPSFLQPFLPSYDLRKLDASRRAVRREIITCILNEGDTQALKWLFKSFAAADIKDAVSRPRRGVWFRESLNYWMKMLSVRLGKKKFEEAMMNVSPLTNK